MKLLKILVASTLLLSHVSVHAEEDTAPLEPPYIEEDSLSSAFEDDSIDVVPPPPKEALSGKDSKGDDLDSLFSDGLDSDAPGMSAESIPPASQPAKTQDPLAAPQKKQAESDLESEFAPSTAEAEMFEDNIETETDVVNEEAPLDESIAPEFAEPEMQVVSPNEDIRQEGIVKKSSSGGVEYIRHPQAANGLISITKEGAYVYDVRKKGDSGTASGSLRLGMMDSPRIEAADGTTYKEMYSESSSPYVMFDYETKIFESFRALSLQFGGGVLYAQGNGRFVNVNPGDTTEAKEKYTFFAVPLNLGLILRLQWSDRQWFVPYVSGGGSYIGVAEMRDDGKGPNIVGTPGAYGAGGMLINITAMSRDAAFTLNNEYGIKNLFVGLEYRRLQTFTEDLDFSSNVISAGVAVDY